MFGVSPSQRDAELRDVEIVQLATLRAGSRQQRSAERFPHRQVLGRIVTVRCVYTMPAPACGGNVHVMCLLTWQSATVSGDTGCKDGWDKHFTLIRPRHTSSQLTRTVERCGVVSLFGRPRTCRCGTLNSASR
jgi:hypothetical protein